MKDVIEEIKKSTLFKNIPIETIKKEILPLGRIKYFSKGNYIFLKSDKIDYLGIIISGHINMLHIFDDGNYTITNTLEPSEILGADLIFTGSRISTHYALATTEVQLFILPDQIIHKPGIVSESCRVELLHRLLYLVSQENMKKDYRLTILYQKGLRERILTYLTMQADKKGTREIAIPFSREEMASFLCVNRSALSHELKKMEAEGILTFKKNKFTLLR